jgi:hypothetical protein
MIDFIHQPYLGIAILLILAFIDLPLTLVARSSYQKYMIRFITYQSVKSGESRKFSVLWVLIKILIAALIFAVWYIYDTADFRLAGKLYLWLLGFAIGSYLIIDIRHLESILLSRLYTRTDLIEGHISYHPDFSLKLSAVQFFSIFIIFSLYAILFPGYLGLGLACAPLFLIIRNLLLS